MHGLASMPLVNASRMLKNLMLNGMHTSHPPPNHSSGLPQKGVPLFAACAGWYGTYGMQAIIGSRTLIVPHAAAA
jgi:hypothetical protein